MTQASSMPSSPGSFSVQRLRGLLDQLAARFAAAPWEEEVRRARSEHDALRGRVYDDDELFETHLALFLEWYVIERPLPGVSEAESLPPVVCALREHGPGAEQREVLQALAWSHRSLFVLHEVRQARGGAVQLLLRDLIGGGLWAVDQDGPMAGLAAGDIFEARLCPWRGRVFFGSTFNFHPREAARAILALLLAAREEGRLEPELVFALSEMRLRYSRFRNIAVEHIYRLGHRFGDVESRAAAERP